MSFTKEQVTFGATIAAVTAVVGVLSALLTLYSQASTVFNDAFELRLKQDFAPVGTITASILDEVEFAKITNENVGDDLKNRKWVLADGRSVVGTTFAKNTDNKPIPDLRGMFLRGIDPRGNRTVGSVENFATALPKLEFSGTTSADGDHDHTFGAAPSGVDRYNAGGSNYPVITASKTGNAGKHSHGLTINAGGDAETRPTNVAVFYYIKIN